MTLAIPVLICVSAFVAVVASPGVMACNADKAVAAPIENVRACRPNEAMDEIGIPNMTGPSKGLKDGFRSF